jgi:predicted PurR-regulated permease PerM
MHHFNAVDFYQTLAVSLPVFAMLFVAIAVACRRLNQLVQKPARRRRQRGIAISVTNAAIGLSFLPFAAIYRPNLIEVVKTQIQQLEDADEDDNGDPETPTKHLHRQLRRIRRGEKVEALSVRLE